MTCQDVRQGDGPEGEGVRRRRREGWDSDPEDQERMGAQQGKEVRGPGERPPPPPPLAGRIGERQGRIKGLRAPPPR